MAFEEEARLPVELLIKAHLRRCFSEGVPAVVVHRGEKNSGIIILKLLQRGAGCRVLTQMRDLDGVMGWLPALDGKAVPESEADAYIDRAVARDPDLWVIEIEHPDGWHPFDGKEI
ncbi:MAG: DUF1491 family protein [Pseudomonadota bacterium]